MKSFCCHVCLKNHPSPAIGHPWVIRVLPLWWSLEFAHFCEATEARKLPLNNLLAISIEMYLMLKEEKRQKKYRMRTQKLLEKRGHFNKSNHRKMVIWQRKRTGKKFNKQKHFATHHTKKMLSMRGDLTTKCKHSESGNFSSKNKKKLNP